MIVKRADFITSMKDYGAFATKGCPEVAFAGKSNVGKSSMINRLTNRNKLARTSATPGKTRLINVYQINNEINFIDLPGYGFAKVSKEEKLSWGKMMQDYFATTEDLCHVFHLVDIRHEPSAEDKEMGMFLRQAGIPFTVVATKADKISRTNLSFTGIKVPAGKHEITLRYRYPGLKAGIAVTVVGLGLLALILRKGKRKNQLEE